MTRRTITYEEAKLRLHYVPETGRLLRTNRVTSGKSGVPIGRITSDGYRRASFLDQTIATSKLVWLLNTGAFPEGNLGRRNGDSTDDRFENLYLIKAPPPSEVLPVDGNTDCSVPQTPGIYQIVCKKNGRVYIGSAVNLDKRWRQHFQQLQEGRHPNCHLQRAWSKYGRESFFFRVVEHVSDSRCLISREQFFIDALSPEFNICRVAGSRAGTKASPELRAKLSAAHLGKPSPRKGVRMDEATKKKISDAKRGVKLGPHSEERKKKAAESMRAARGAITVQEVLKIRQMHASGLKCTEIAATLQRGYYAVHDVIRGRSYSWV